MRARVTKRILFTALCVTAISAAHAQVVCNTWGNTTSCNGSLGSSGLNTTYVSPFQDYYKQQADAAQAQAQAQALAAQAELARQQAELTRQQAALIATQREALEQQQAVTAEAQRKAAETARQQQETAARLAEMAGVSTERYAAAQARCRTRAGDSPLCNQLTAEDVQRSEAAAGIKP